MQAFFFEKKYRKKKECNAGSRNFQTNPFSKIIFSDFQAGLFLRRKKILFIFAVIFLFPQGLSLFLKEKGLI